MRKSNVKPVKQPDGVTCGPSSLAVALKILGKRVPLQKLITLCKTNQGGTSSDGIIRAVRRLGLTAATLQKASRKHIIASLARNQSIARATIIGYFYDMERPNKLDLSSGHWATVASFSPTQNRIVLFDSYTGKRISYQWTDFRKRWIDYTLKRRYLGKGKRKFRMVKKWLPGPMLVIAPTRRHLPAFSPNLVKVYA